MKENVGKKYVDDSVEGKEYVYMLVSNPDKTRFNLMEDNGVMMFFNFMEAVYMKEFLEKLKLLA